MDTTMSLRFNKLRFVKKLQEDNQSPEIEEAFADALDDALKQSQSALAQELKAEIRTEISQPEVRLTSAMYKMVGFILIGVGVLMGLMKFIN